MDLPGLLFPPDTILSNSEGKKAAIRHNATSEHHLKRVEIKYNVKGLGKRTPCGYSGCEER